LTLRLPEFIEDDKLRIWDKNKPTERMGFLTGYSRIGLKHKDSSMYYVDLMYANGDFIYDGYPL
jgi:hypothetical protein